MRIVESLLNLAYKLFKPKTKPAKTQPKPPAPVVEPKPEVVVVPPKPIVKLYETIPMPTGKYIAASVDTLKQVSVLTGVRADYMALIIALESSFDYSVKAKTSSARGWFQVIDKTWKVLLSRYGERYEIPTDSKEELRFDPRINALMGAELIKENVNVIQPSLKRELTLSEIYLAHFFGAGNAKKFLSLSDATIAASVFPTQAKANVPLFYLNGKPRTVKEFKAYIDKKIAKSIDLVNKTFN